jgi:hypothetical protein
MKLRNPRHSVFSNSGAIVQEMFDNATVTVMDNNVNFHTVEFKKHQSIEILENGFTILTPFCFSERTPNKSLEQNAEGIEQNTESSVQNEESEN